MPTIFDGQIEPSFRTEKFRWLSQKVRLDLLILDQEVQEIGVLLKDAGECVSLAVELREVAKEDLDKTKSEVAGQLRVASAANGGKEWSEARIDKEFSTQIEYRASQQVLSNARLDAALWQNLFDALKSKNYNIATSVELFKSGYLTVDYVLSKRREEVRNVTPKRETVK